MQSGILTESGRNKPLREIKKSLENNNAKFPMKLFMAIATGAAALTLGVLLYKKLNKQEEAREESPSSLLH